MKSRLLIIDDDVPLTRMLRSHLEKTGAYALRVAHTGARGLAAAKRFQPDLILLDVVMPDSNGVEVAAALRAEARLAAVPIVLLTAQPADHLAEAGCRVLAKPVRAAALLACVEEQLARPAGAAHGA